MTSSTARRIFGVNFCASLDGGGGLGYATGEYFGAVPLDAAADGFFY